MDHKLLLGCLQTYTRPEVGNNVKEDSSEKITFFHCSIDQFWKFLHHSRRFETLAFDRRGFLIAALPWNPALCSSLRTVFVETGFCRCSLSSAVILGAVVLRSTLTIQFKAQRSLSDSFLFLPEFCLAEEVFPSFSKAVITFDTVPLETLSI